MSTQLLLSLWREACRHIELHESIVRMAQLVRRRLPAELVLVRRLDADQHFVESIAVASSGVVPVPRLARSPVSEEEVGAITSWCRRDEVLRAPAGRRNGLLKMLLPHDIRGSVLAGALLSESGSMGVLLMVGRADAFTPEEEQIFTPLLEPFTAAYENHLRLQELDRLRKAAEADKTALLSRLKRREIVETVIGVDGALQSVMQRVEQVAATGAPVLILGETGTGKEVIARAIHARSSRRDGPIVRVNCGAIPSELVDSELFGHEKGSFTGAVNLRRGWFERADGGTLFLDEIGELPLAAQVRLLRILQDGSYERVGGQQTLTADVRILAATHRDIERLVRAGQFREDLWYRISVFPITLPPLRERKPDISALANHFAHNSGLRLRGYPLNVSEEDLRLLSSYAWPGNVRELAAVIERATILGGGQRLDVAGAMGRRIPDRLNGSELAVNGAEQAVELPGSNGLKTLDEAMTLHIVAALRMTGGRIEGPGGAAALLDIHPNTLRARMQKLGVDWRAFRQDTGTSAAIEP